MQEYKIKVLITKEVYKLYEYDYGKYRRTGTPSIGMHTVEFDTRKEAETFKQRKDAEDYNAYESTTVEILN